MARTSDVLADVIGSLRRLLAAGTIRAFVAAQPVPAPRPRVMPYGAVFYGKRYDTYTADLQKAFAEQRARAPLEGPLMLAIVVSSARPKSTKLSAPLGDVDNHAKGPMDALTKTARFWLDDKQIETLVVHKRWAAPGEPGHVEVHIAPMEA